MATNEAAQMSQVVQDIVATPEGDTPELADANGWEAAI